jgi:hypothetical protein
MSQRERISIIGLGVIVGTVLGLIYNDMAKCLVTGIVAASAITLMLSQQAKRSTPK